MNSIEFKEICKKHKTTIDVSGNIYVHSENKSKRIGKIYYKDNSRLYHIELVSGTKLEGQKNFENSLLLLLKYLGL